MSVLRMSTGRSFQIVGQETRKLRQPKGDSTRGTTRSPWSADLRRERAVTVCTGMYTSLKYFGHRQREQSNTTSAILKVMHCDIGSQCSVSRSVGVMWSKGVYRDMAPSTDTGRIRSQWRKHLLKTVMTASIVWNQTSVCPLGPLNLELCAVSCDLRAPRKMELRRPMSNLDWPDQTGNA